MNLVLYSSKSGNTKKLADTVFAALPEPKEICPLDKIPGSLNNYDLIALGFWFQGGQPDAASQAVLAKIQNKDLLLFASHGAAKKSAHATNGLKMAQDLAPSCRIVGTYSCQGEVNPKVTATAESKPERPPWLDDAPAAVGHPDKADLQELKTIIEDLI